MSTIRSRSNTGHRLFAFIVVVLCFTTSFGMPLNSTTTPNFIPTFTESSSDVAGARVTLCTSKDLTKDCYTVNARLNSECAHVKDYKRYGDKGSSFGMNDAPFACQLYESKGCLANWQIKGQQYSDTLYYPGMMNWDQDWIYRAYICWPQKIVDPPQIERAEVD